MVNSGMKAATMIAVENNTALSTCKPLIRISRSRSVHVGLLDGSPAPVGSSPQRFSASCCISRCFSSGPAWKIAIDVLDHDNGGVDDDAEIDRADRQQVGVFAAQDKDDDAEEQRERDIGADDDGAAQVAEEQPLNQENQQTAEQ